MNAREKAKVLGYAGRYDSCGPKACEVEVNGGLGGIYYANKGRAQDVQNI